MKAQIYFGIKILSVTLIHTTNCEYNLDNFIKIPSSRNLK